MGSLCTCSFRAKPLPFTSTCYGSGQVWSSVCFEISRKNLVWERIKYIPLSPASTKCLTILVQCNLKVSTLTSSFSHLACSLVFVSWSPSSSKTSCQHPGNICLGISATVWSCCSSVWDLCLQRKSVQQQHQERKKGGKRALYNRINRAVAIVTQS